MTAPPFPPFSAVLIMGGQSARMGSDKAMLPWPTRPLWKHQMDVLRALHPAELLVSARPDQALTGQDFLCIHDANPRQGPLAGISAALEAARTEWLVVLAVDLPAMTPAFLTGLLDIAFTSGRGQIPLLAGRFEPLAAIYPRTCAPISRSLLAGSDYSLRQFVSVLKDRGMIEIPQVSPADAALFYNLNTPADHAAAARYLPAPDKI